MKRDLYAEVTNKIVAQLEAGVRPWAPSWSGGDITPLRANGEPYRGVNVLMLWAEQMAKGYTQRRWLTFKQAKEAGGRVRKGERSALVIYVNAIERENEDGEAVRIPFLRSYNVFNVEQIDGLGAEWFETPPAPGEGPDKIPAAEAFFAATGAEVRHGGGRAFFSPSQDFVQMPPLPAFNDAVAYYGTLAHECVHWTGHESRLNRTFGKRFGDHAYAAEELVAEMGAAFLCASLGLEVEPREDHASYLASWLKVLKSDHRAIFTAASAAQAASDYLHKLAAEGRKDLAA